MATKALTVNVPLRTKIKYIDVWPNDPSKNNGKGYGASLSLKDEAGDRIYPKGFLDRNLETLRAAGVISSGDVYDDNPAEKYSIPVLHGDVEIYMEQPAGEKYARFAVKVIGGNGKPPIASALPQNAPKHVPGDEDDGYMASLTGDVDNSGIDFDALKSRYKECVDYVQIAWGKDTSDVALVAAAATLFIARNQQRI